MKINITSSILAIQIILGCGYLLPMNADAARAAIRRSVTNGTQATTTATTQTTVSEEATENQSTQKEEIAIENKSNQFSTSLKSTSASSDDSDDGLASQIRKQREALQAKESSSLVEGKQKVSLATGKNACDTGLRTCMQKECGTDFSNCALDGDTIFGDKLNRCRKDLECTAEEFKLFSTEIKADRDLNAQLASYTAIIECGNNYNSCLVTECGATFSKCLGKTDADKAIKNCSTIAKNCTEQDSGMSARFGTVIARLRESAEQDIKRDEERMYELRDLMRTQCEHLGAMFDERSFDCVYTINFFAGEDQSTPMASRKAYAGGSFTCMQEWFGINATTFKENAYRLTKSQTAASSAVLGSGVGTAVGTITSGAIDRAVDTQKAKKEYKEEECTQEGGKWNSILSICIKKKTDDSD